jgi:hypothetical protein
VGYGRGRKGYVSRTVQKNIYSDSTKNTTIEGAESKTGEENCPKVNI